MSNRYRMDDGTVVDTDRATQSWPEATRWDGSNHISVATGSQWHHEALHRSRKGRYYVERWSAIDGVQGGADWISKRAAAAWLLCNQHAIPADLTDDADAVTE